VRLAELDVGSDGLGPDADSPGSLPRRVKSPQYVGTQQCPRGAAPALWLTAASCARSVTLNVLATAKAGFKTGPDFTHLLHRARVGTWIAGRPTRRTWSR
jgi:hypothetical protein